MAEADSSCCKACNAKFDEIIPRLCILSLIIDIACRMGITVQPSRVVNETKKTCSSCNRSALFLTGNLCDRCYKFETPSMRCILDSVNVGYCSGRSITAKPQLSTTAASRSGPVHLFTAPALTNHTLQRSGNTSVCERSGCGRSVFVDTKGRPFKYCSPDCRDLVESAREV